jgi:hypothetical protein
MELFLCIATWCFLLPTAGRSTVPLFSGTLKTTSFYITDGSNVSIRTNGKQGV